MDGFEKRTAAKKQRVLQAAFDLMNTDAGMANLTMAAVAKRAGVGKTSVFNYFESKTQLIETVFEHYMDSLVQEAQAIIDEQRPFDVTMMALSENKIRHVSQIKQQFFLDFMAVYTQTDAGGLSLLMQTYNQNNVSMLLDLFQRGRRAGQVDPKYSDEFLLLYFQAMITGISSPTVYERILPYTAEWTEMLIKSLAPTPN